MVITRETWGHLIESPSRPRCLQHRGGLKRGFIVKRKYFPPSVQPGAHRSWYNCIFYLVRRVSAGMDFNGNWPFYSYGLKRGWRVTLSAYHLCGNFGEKFWSNGTVFLGGHRKQERDWVVPLTIYWKNFHFLSTWNLALVIQTNGTENFGRFAKNGKKVIPRKVLLFSGKSPPGWTVPFEFSKQTVSAPCFDTNLPALLCKSSYSHAN